ncbi:MAG: ABC transporter substrate-binding protein [Anaerolineae bacterium]|nr:ABC transporter substrate-binding protein [Anaerolineae bacterium]
MRKRFLLAAVLVFCLSVFSLGTSLAQDDVVIVAADVQDIITLDPARAYETTNLTVFHAVYETLINTPASDLTAFEPGLAASWEVSEDGLVYTFKLREGVTFVSGNPLRAEDVRFSWVRLKNIKGSPSFYADAVSAVEAVDDLTVKVTLSAPTPAFLSIVTVPSLSVLDSEVVKANGGTDAEDADVTDTAGPWLDQNSAGTGPFTLTGWTPNTQVTMVRNDSYWQGAAALAGVTLAQVNDSTTALQQLERGDVDIVDNIEKDLAEQVTANSSLKLEQGQSLNLSYIAMSPNETLGGPLGSKDVRQAVAYSIDYDGILDGLLLGYTDRPAAMLPLGIQGSDPSLRYERDLAKAAELLSAAGFADGVDVTLSLGSGGICGIPAETIGAKIQADLAEAKINATVNIMQSSNFLTDYRAQKLQMVLGTWTPDYLDATMWSDYFSYPDVGPSFRIMLDVPEIAAAAAAGAVETDTAARNALYLDYQKAHVDAAVFVPVCQNRILVATSSQIENYVFHPVYFFDFYAMSKSS